MAPSYFSRNGEPEDYEISLASQSSRDTTDNSKLIANLMNDYTAALSAQPGKVQNKTYRIKLDRSCGLIELTAGIG